MFGRIRRSVRFWRERDFIIKDMQDGLYSVAETLERLAEHAKPGGSERSHVFSCRNGFAPCACPFLFDTRKYVPLTTDPQEESTWRDLR